MKHQEHWLVVIYIAAALAIALPSARAATTWDTAGSGDKLNWSDANNWNPAGVPGDGAEVVITNGSVLLTNATYNLASLTITGATTRLTFSNWDTKLAATNVIIQNGATVTHVTNSALTTNELGEWPTNGRVWIVCTNLNLQAGGQIDVSGRGFLGGLYTNGCGPGGGGLAQNATIYYGGAGGHGGNGGRAHYYGVGPAGLAYDLTNAPMLPGSGGAGQGLGAGGGAVRIDAGNGTVTIEGTINANGRDSGAVGGGGAGGSIYITCGMVGGSSNGSLIAKGGNGYYSSDFVCSGHGGGGRIAIAYDEADQGGQPKPGIRLNTATGAGVYVTPPPVIGTLYLPDDSVLTTNMSNFENVRIYGVTNLSLDSLYIATSNICFSESIFSMKVTRSLVVDSVIFQVGSGYNKIEDAPEYTQIECGDLQLTSQGTTQSLLYVYCGPTNEAWPDYGARVAVAGDIVIASNCWIYPVSQGTNGGSAYFSANNVTIDAGGGFDADGLGYDAGPTNIAGIDGFGPGGGKGDASNGRGGGGGYGGKGDYARAAGGVAYGYTNAPIFAGSGGGGGLAGFAAKPGGGLVWIKAAEKFVLNGTLRANGESGVGNYRAAGSGGGIFIAAGRRFLPGENALLSAYGGSQDGVGSARGGAGGGGRIAIWHHISEAEGQTILADPDNAAANVPRLLIFTNLVDAGFAGSFAVTNGGGVAGVNESEPGSFVILTVPPPSGTIFLLR
ncbi:MAG: hypothetical protein PHW60_01920 [Kiritimatiellae bacterium]|nr:hypothetical protein [Kiritimatiellia bacterium]